MRTLIHNQKEQTLNLTTTPIPDIQNGQYLIKVHSVTVTGTELFWVRPPERNISVPGVDFAGQVVQSPSDSTGKFKVGDEVYARTTFDRPGNAREYSVAYESEMTLRPKNLSPEEATTVPMSAQTAYQALFVQGGLKAPTMDRKSDNTGKRVFITGASGGTGVWLVQLAKAAGAYVIGSCGPSNIDLVKSLGADEVINYRKTNPAEWAKSPSNKVDLVVDCVGGKAEEDAWRTLKDDGLLLTIVPPPSFNYKYDLDPPEGVSKTIRGRFWIMEVNVNQLEQCSRWIEEGKMKAVMDSVWNFEDFKEAFKRVDSGHARGKVVLRIGSPS